METDAPNIFIPPRGQTRSERGLDLYSQVTSICVVVLNQGTMLRFVQHVHGRGCTTASLCGCAELNSADLK